MKMKIGAAAFIRTVASLLLVIGLTACSDSSDAPVSTSLDPSSAPDMPGPFAVGRNTFTVIDTARDNRSLAVEAWYPVDAQDRPEEPEPTSYELGPGIGLPSALAVDDLPVSRRTDHPLLVYSHGYGGINTASVALTEILASHGFIVVSPEHTGNSQNSQDDSFDEAASRRVPDVSFLIDIMFERNRDPDDMFYQHINEEKVGVLGHSFGGMTALGMAAGWAGVEPDPRVKAIVPMSAVIRAELQSDERSGPNAGFTPEQLARILVPVMLVGGTADFDVFLENNSIAFSEINNSPAVYQLDIMGANHTHFANVCDIGNLLIGLGIPQDNWPAVGAEDLLEPYAMTCTPDAFPIEEAFRLQNLYTVSFFRRHLLDDRRYDTYLTPDSAENEPAATLKVK